MELRRRKIQNEKVAARNEGSESRKRRRSNRREKTIDRKDRERQRLRCLIEGGLWENTSSSKYEPDYTEMKEVMVRSLWRWSQIWRGKF